MADLLTFTTESPNFLRGFQISVRKELFRLGILFAHTFAYILVPTLDQYLSTMIHLGEAKNFTCALDF